MKIDLTQFGGAAPLVDPAALADKLSTFARNVRFDRGVLAPGGLRMTTTDDYPDSEIGGTLVQSVAKMFEDGTRFAFSEAEASTAFSSPVSPTDQWGRVYFMSPTGAAFSTTDQYSPGALNKNPVSFMLGIPAPDIAPNIPNSGVVVDLEEADEVSVSYAYSFVDSYGHEGPLSPASRAITLAYDRTHSVEILFSEPPPLRTHMAQGVRRVYRAAFDGTTSVYQYLMDAPASSSRAVDTYPLGEEGEEAVSLNWWPADPAMTQLCLVGSAFAAGILDHYLCYSESRLPHAWPYELQYPLKYQPVKLLPMTNGLLVCTTGRPYWAEGTDPYSAYPRELASNAPCMAPDSVVDMGGFAIYASQDGFFMVDPTTSLVRNLSADYIDRAGMSALVDETCTAFEFEGRYVFSTIDNTWMAFRADDGFVEYDFGFPPSEFATVSHSLRDNRHYFALKSAKVRVVDFEGDASDSEWHSKHFLTPPVSFSCLKVAADTYPVWVDLRSQYLGQEWQSTMIKIPGPHIHRVPAHYGTLWQVGLFPPKGGRVYGASLAQSASEVI